MSNPTRGACIMTPLCRKPNVSLHIRVSAMCLGYQSPKSVDSP